ncbi:L,D-transpeptidase family protein [Rhodoligotrophos ferricapiens]|uniref:L,D-transpeptidase family protein n=1 Tax=Rhodoligotrophos ferricapiens TaxID=3069264 RepID=UPI00315DEB4C
MTASLAILRRSTSRRKFLLGGLAATTSLVVGFSESVRAEAPANFSAWNSVQQMAPTITYVAYGKNVQPMLNSMSEASLQDAIARYEIIASRGGWPMLPPGQKLSKGGQGQLVGMLRDRLAIEGYGAHGGADPMVFDAGLADAVKKFQKNHGLMTTGTVDNETINALNVPVEERLFTMRANLPRMKEYAKNLGAHYITINIPATQLETVENGTVYSVHNVVVGMTDRPSPVVLSRVSDVTFNPYWIAPASIVKKDIIPKAQKDPSFLIQQRIRIHDGLGGPEIDPMSIDWSTLDPERYIFRQDPGDDNAMATVKIHFPNKYAVYMHDTPTKNLFTAEARYFSSGCVRVDQVHIVTEWLLRANAGWDRSRIEQVIASGQNTKVDVVQNTPVRMVYMTAWAMPDGTVNFRPDIYRLDGTGFVAGQPEPIDQYAGMTPQPSGGAQPTMAVSAPGGQAPVAGARDAWQRANGGTY